MEKEKALKGTAKTVMNCYDFFDAIPAATVVIDFTDGKYDGDRDVSYEEAQSRQAEWLLDQIDCKEGDVVLDVGCGNGRILRAIEKRGAKAIGITISQQQMMRDCADGLDVRLLNYKNIPEDWNGKFDGIIANGSMEHFVQVSDAVLGKADEIYEEMFSILSRILKPGGKFASTVIHMNEKEIVFDPKEIVKGSSAFDRASDNFHYALLVEGFGGWYPTENQLETSASRYFNHINREDGTEDYHWTSESWLEMLQKHLISPKFIYHVFLKLIKHPIITSRVMDSIVFAQSWQWQFRKRANGTTPTILYRDVWQKIR